MNGHILLVCTVGGTPQAVATAIKGCQPDRVVFVPSPETKMEIEGSIIPLVSQARIQLNPGQYEVAEVSDAQDFTACVTTMREIDRQIAGWVKRGADYRVVVDITTGTKCMSAALALVARRWPCHFSYVGGSERNKGGKGVVVNGEERVLHTQNPWDALGYQAAEDATVLFDRGNYWAAVDTLKRALPFVDRPDLKQEMNTLNLVADAYLRWDLFRHKDASDKLEQAQRNANNLRHLLPENADSLIKTISEHRAFLGQFKGVAGRHYVVDLCANARRCSQRGHSDDAVARLYRAIEAAAQVHLKEFHGIDNTGHVPLDKIPSPLRQQWQARAKEGTVMLGLQDDYKLLLALGVEMGRRFEELGLSEKGSPLQSRNQSVLAHGFEPVGEKVVSQLWDKTLELTGVKESELPVFPRLAVRQQSLGMC